MSTWLNRGASGGLAGASIKRRSEETTLGLQPPVCSRLMRVDKVGPSRNSINTRCRPITISAHAQAQVTKACPAARARPLGGGCGSSLRWVRIFSITGCSRMAAMIFSSPPPQFEQRCMAMSKTRFSTRV